MSHIEIARAYSQEMEQNPNHQALVLFGSVARGTSGPESDLDVLLFHRRLPEIYTYKEIVFSGIKVGVCNLDIQAYRRAIIEEPFNRIILAGAQVLFDRTNKVQHWIGAVERYFVANPDIKEEWDRAYADYHQVKLDPTKEPDDIYYIYIQNSHEYKGRILQEPIP